MAGTGTGGGVDGQGNKVKYSDTVEVRRHTDKHMHHVNTSCQYTLSTHPVNEPRQYILSVH